MHRVDDEVFWHVDGSCVPVEYISTPILKDGKLNGAVVIFRDISRRKEIERQREEAHDELSKLQLAHQLILDAAGEGIYGLDSEGRITFGNAASTEILGWDASDVCGQRAHEVHHHSHADGSSYPREECPIYAAITDGKVHRVDKPLVKVNCASIPKDLFESEFFGHVRGAFTGAHQDRAGRLQLADGGTLFLDEVGEIPMSQQGKLLRALEEGEFERVGDDKTMKVDVRVVAATNRNLMDEIKAGQFREDLYYRLSVFPLEVPPLRDRLDDVAPLAVHFLRAICRELGREPLRMTQSQLSLLKRQDWPGNIRELKNVIERAVISATGGHLRLDLALPNAPAENRLSTRASAVEPSEFVTVAEFREIEKANVMAALQHAGWKVWGPDGAADLLGVKPSTLAYQMKALGIEKVRHSGTS